MIWYVLRRLRVMIPTIFGITLVTFVLINLAVDTPDTSSGQAGASAMDQETAQEVGRAFGLHLPMFVNFSIADVSQRVNEDVAALSSPGTRARATRSLTRRGTAVLPDLVGHLQTADSDTQEAILGILDRIAEGIGMGKSVSDATDKRTFWEDYMNTYGADFTPIRANRLVRRYVKRDDQLALRELNRLGSYALPQLMEALDEDQPVAEQHRIASLLCAFTGRQDPIDPSASFRDRADTVFRWREWWYQRYDLYSSFEGIDRVTGTITETRYFRWLTRVATFDFGVSSRDGRPIRDKLAQRLPVTLLLAVLSLLFSYIIAIPLGVLTAVKKGSLFDRSVGVSMFVLFSLPSFWVAMILLRYVGSTGYLSWFPAQGIISADLPETASLWTTALDVGHHLVLPVLCMSFVSIAMLTRFQRVGMLRVVEQDYIRAAKARGLSGFQAIVKHGLRNGVIPVITLMSLQLPYLISSSVVIERVFGIPGMGFETFEAIRASDYYWLMAMVTVMAVLTTLGILAADVVYALVDPRIAPGRKLGQHA